MDKVYYRAATKAFTNALKFWDHINKTDESFYFHLYDNEFSKADWTSEPNETIDQLCAKRAKAIREKYDWVRIWYSAGRDSHHILKTFLDNNLRIDELMIMDWSIMKRFETDAKISYETAVKTFNQYKSQSKVEISIIQPDKDDFNQYFHKDYFLNGGGYGSNYNFNLNHYPNIMQFFPEYNEGQNNSCEVFGFEKSKVHMDENGKFYFQMNDKNFNQGLGEANNLEWFYLSGDHPEIAIKQSHMIMNFLRNTYSKTLTSAEVNNFQEGKGSYDMFASVLNRGAKISEQTGGGINKTFGFHREQYKEIFEVAFNENWTALNHYNDFVDHVSALNHYGSNKFWQLENHSFAGVPTKKYYLT